MSISNENKLKECPFCGEEIKQEAILCKYCKRTISKSVEHQENILEQDKVDSNGQVCESHDTKECPFCGEEIKREAILCKFCKRKIPELQLQQGLSNPNTTANDGQLIITPKTSNIDVIPNSKNIANNINNDKTEGKPVPVETTYSKNNYASEPDLKIYKPTPHDTTSLTTKSKIIISLLILFAILTTLAIYINNNNNSQPQALLPQSNNKSEFIDFSQHRSEQLSNIISSNIPYSHDQIDNIINEVNSALIKYDQELPSDFKNENTYKDYRNNLMKLITELKKKQDGWDSSAQQTPAPQTNPTSSDSEEAEAMTEQELSIAFNDFITAWKKMDYKNQEKYISYDFIYSDQQKKQNRDDYLSSKKRLYAKYPWIVIDTENINYEINHNFGIVSFNLHYKAPGYESWGQETITFRKHQNTIEMTSEVFNKIK